MLPRFHLLSLHAFILQVVKAEENSSILKATLVCISILILLSGCAMNQPYGSFIQDSSPAFSQYSKVMANDVADQIGRLYPAASTQFDLRHNANDPFGQALIDKLRSDGFAVLENTTPANPFLAAIQSPKDSENISNSPISVEDIKNHGLALGYIIDQSDDLYHVSILIEDQQLTRAFIAQSGQIQPAGSWVRKE
ncbi:MAG: conjugal transfer protein TrbH [Burkholderiales bacterium]|nr:conjugal transfer protein TrbH [Burkholderiales bacterium]